MNSDIVKFNVRMPRTLTERADKYCAAKGISRNAAINMALADWCVQQEKIDAVMSEDVIKEVMVQLAKAQLSSKE